MNALAAFLSRRSKVARLRAEAARVDAEFEQQEHRAQAELDAVRMRNAIESSERVLARFSIEVPPKVSSVLLAVLFLTAGAAFADDRRSVKNLLDPGAKNVRLAPAVPTTIRALVALPVPQNIFGPRGRTVRVSPVETTVWRVRARLVHVEHEADGDIHLVLAEPDDAKVIMIAEIPEPVRNQAHAAEWRAVRDAIAERMLCGKTDRLVVVEGVGFFDYLHDGWTAAPNGIELHPVLRLTFEAPR